jgi:hypothetical protein
VGPVIARKGAETACRDGQARGRQSSPSPSLKCLCQTRFRNRAVLSTTRRSLPSLHLCVFFFWSRRKWIKDLLGTFATSRASWIRTKDGRHEKRTCGVGAVPGDLSHAFPPTNSCDMRVTGPRGCTLAMPRVASEYDTVALARANENNGR